MIILISGASMAVRIWQEITPKCIGQLIVPFAGNSPHGMNLVPERWAIDNGAFSHFNADRFLFTLDRFSFLSYHCLFVAAPDVVGNAAETLELFDRWEPIIRSYGYRVALVSQDGLPRQTVPWSRLDAMFIGGSTEWKLSPEAATYGAYALARGKWLHMGRVNTRERLRYAHSIGCGSIDGTGVSRWSWHWIPKYVEWLREMGVET